MSTAAPFAEGSTITLTGYVTRSFGMHVIQLGTAPTEPVLVVFSTPSAYENGTRLEVRGRIATFAREDLEAELEIDLGPEVEELRGSTCLVAVSVRAL